MIVTRCPHCQTGFRVTPEQIKACDGHVRCGECSEVFDALENLITAQGVAPTPAAEALPQAPGSSEPSTEGHVPADPEAPSEPPPSIDASANLGPLGLTEHRQAAPTTAAHDDTPDTVPAAAIPAFLVRTAASADTENPAPTAAPPATNGVTAQDAEPTPTNADLKPLSSAGASTDEAPAHARAAGLSAARDTRDVPGYNKWSEGTLTSSGSVFVEPKRPPRWPYVLTALLLAAVLAGQAALQFRSELAARVPAAAPLLTALCQFAHCTVGLPRQAELISIEASELQSDPERGGLLVLAATLRNRAPFAQDFPALELALTDTRDQPLVRKVLLPADYLPAAAAPATGIAAGADQPVRLWLDGKAVGAAGYRLYVFYP